ncbi:MAG: acetyl-CoA carboxylase carboxyl transferase subunit beta [Coriobacteriales bacterium]|jgi:acetyl-CoA carboxylase carboxyl transferase subunit beta|nr:acetyl-CoA carboxylase carboxyl transferase subunit beta [Coriobacteriales bacterium]
MGILDIFSRRKQQLDNLAAARERARKKRGKVHIDSRIDQILDPDSRTDLFDDIAESDPLGFPGYPDKLRQLQKRTGLQDACICAAGTIAGHDLVAVEMRPEFMMASMGSVVGEQVTRSIEYAQAAACPLLIICASGGARMQEGMFSLMQMAKTSIALKDFANSGGLYISVLTNPTTGGVTASFASLADVTLAEPGALIGFAGPRVIEQTIGQKLPDGFQSAEFQLEHGFVDRIVGRADLRGELTAILGAYAQGNLGDRAKAAFVSAQHAAPASLESDIPAKPKKDKLSAAEHVRLARDPARPHFEDFLAANFEDFRELHGDRLSGDDKALRCGFAWLGGRPLFLCGTVKGRDVNSNIACNFGMASPAGYRKFIRVAHLAEKFGLPLVTVIDTPGAYPGKEAEERGQGEAIARCLYALADLKVPVVAVLTGEGGSGGALALAVADYIIMYQNATYSVLSPEGFASILWKDASRADEAAGVMKLTAADLWAAQLVDQVVAEPKQKLDPQSLGLAVEQALVRLASQDSATLVRARRLKFRKF